MAKAGSGDVLTGLLAGILAQGYNVRDAGILGMYIHGYAGDIARELFGENAMTPSDQINQFGTAFGNLF
jgi:NAD(P)H-hydrate epimerase